MADDSEGAKRADVLANKMIDMLNEAATTGHPADAITALQFATAAVLEAYNIPTDLFLHRVICTMERIRSGGISKGRRS